jgi:hypothetical protein
MWSAVTTSSVSRVAESQVADRLSGLLREMHAAGIELKDSSKALERAWGRHLLEDWRSLELLGERLDGRHESPGTEEASLLQDEPVQTETV